MAGAGIEIFDGPDSGQLSLQLAQGIRPPSCPGRSTAPVHIGWQDAYLAKHEWLTVAPEGVVPVETAGTGTGGSQLLQRQPLIFRVGIDTDPVDVTGSRVVGDGILCLVAPNANGIPQPLDVTDVIAAKDIDEASPRGDEFMAVATVMQVVPFAAGKVELPERPDQNVPIRRKFRWTTTR